MFIHCKYTTFLLYDVGIGLKSFTASLLMRRDAGRRFSNTPTLDVERVYWKKFAKGI